MSRAPRLVGVRNGSATQQRPFGTSDGVTSLSGASVELARERFARTFADVLSRRYAGRWDVEWEGADGPALPADRDGRTFAGEK